jgi:glycosyltransferase involved in cell wall biosynthesis
LQNLQLLGELSPGKMAGLLAARPIFASAALYEPFGLSVLEAAQAGCALVLSDIPTHRELWEGTAVFVPPADDAAFASAVADLIGDAERRAKLGRFALARAQLFTPERMAAGMAGIYARLLNAPARQQPASELAGAAA